LSFVIIFGMVIRVFAFDLYCFDVCYNYFVSVYC
jgi:hypothetical protein